MRSPRLYAANDAISAYPLSDIHLSIVFETTQGNRISLARSTKIYSAWSREVLVSLLSLASLSLLVPLAFLVPLWRTWEETNTQ